MEDRTLHPLPDPSNNNIQVVEIERSRRETPPAHYTLKIKSFSLLSKIISGDHKYESADFPAGDCKWKLVLYPKGNPKRDGDGHISLYLALADADSVSVGCQIDVKVTFFVYDQIRDNYLTIQDGKFKRLHALKTEHGFDKLLPLSTFENPCNGYLVDDCCAFGVEVLVLKRTSRGEEFSLVKAQQIQTGSYTWKIAKYSKLQDKYCYSESFRAGEYKWTLKLYHKGCPSQNNRSLSLFLYLRDSSALVGQRVYAEYTLMVKDQVYGIDEEQKGGSWFSNKNCNRGYSTFMRLNELCNPLRGFLVKDTLFIKAKIDIVAVVQDLSRKE